MIVDSERPFANLIISYAEFRQAVVHNLINGFLTTVVVTRKEVEGEFPLQTEVLVSQVSPVCTMDGLKLRGYLEISEGPNNLRTWVRVMRNVVGARNDDIVLGEVCLDDDHIAEYLNRFYHFLVTDEWEG